MELDPNTDMDSDFVEAERERSADKPSPWAGLGTRAISGAALAAIFLVTLLQGGWLFVWLILMAALIMAREWQGLTENEPVSWRVFGLFYVTIPCASLIWLRGMHTADMPDLGRGLVLFVVLAVVATDIGAYFTGRKFGGPKLAPEISPGKTWAGLGGGVVAAAVVCGIAYAALGVTFPSSLGSAIVWGGMLAVLAQASDLFESWVKRRAGVKDSGTLLPGHGGLLDRVDGLVFTLPVFAFFAWLSA